MKTPKYLYYLLLLIAQNLFGQSSGNISFGLGFSNPLGQFSATDFYDSTSGYGQLGLAYSLRYEKNYSNGFGIFLNIQNASIGFDIEEYLKDGEEELGNGWKWSEYSTSRYNIKSLNLGGQYVLNREHKFNVIPFLGLGISACRSYDMDFTYVNGSNNLRAKYNEDNQTVLNLNFGFNLNYDISERVGIILKLNYQSQIPTFSNDYQIYINGINADNGIDKRNQPMFFSTTTFGIKYKLSLES